jgi:hypothetical protein
MRLNWLAYNYRGWDGYGIYSARLIQALRRAGVDVTPHFAGAADAPRWLSYEWGMDWSMPTISCLPPFYLRKLPAGHAPHWLLTMTEGSQCPDGWADIINQANIDHVIVPCQWNADAFREGGVECPISVVHGGTDPDEFPLLKRERDAGQPYTFLALADRGSRKGWDEVYRAFYFAFGGKTTGNMDVRLVIKSRPDGNELINDRLVKVDSFDTRITFDRGDYADMADLYRTVDCFVIPSRGEGWGMPHREASMMGVPVITQRFAGMDDGHTDAWAMVVEGGRMQPIPAATPNIKGEVRVCDHDELARLMWRCYQMPAWAAEKGQQAAAWLRSNQTWAHSAAALLQELQHAGVLEAERVYA